MKKIIFTAAAAVMLSAMLLRTVSGIAAAVCGEYRAGKFR